MFILFEDTGILNSKKMNLKIIFAEKQGDKNWGIFFQTKLENTFIRQGGNWW